MNPISIDSKSIEYDVIEIQSRSMSDPSFPDIDFRDPILWVCTTLKCTDCSFQCITISALVR